MRYWLRGVWMGMLSWVWASAPCAHCQENPLCLGSCSYELLLKAETPVERLQAQVLLGKAWVLGGFQEGAVNLLLEALREAPPSEVALRAEARYWLAQAYQRIAPDSTQYYYKLVYEDATTPPYWKAKAALALSSLLSGRNPTRAQAYASDALALAKQAGDAELQALALNQLAFFAAAIRQYPTALKYAEEALRLARSIPKPRLLSAILTNLATIYDDMGRSSDALKLYQEALQIAPDTLSRAHALLSLANHYYNEKKTTETERLLNQVAPILSKLPFSLRQDYYRLRFYIATERRALDEAAKYFESVLSEADKALQEAELNRAAQLEQLSGLRQRESQLRQLELSRQRERIFYGLMGVLALVALGGVGYAYWTARRRAREEAAFRQEIEKLNRSLQQQSEELERQNQELIRVSNALFEALEDLRASISAAERLQKALMPPLSQILPGTAFHYQPMQQIGGDFYIATRDVFSGRYLIAVGDATGHGVAGAILASIFGATIQNFFLQNPRQSAQALLMRVHAFASRLLVSQESDKSSIREGCDAAIVIFDIPQQKVEVGLAGRPLWIWEPQAGLQELEGGRRGIDSFTPSDYEFPTYTLPLSPQSVFYLFTDGLTDVLNPQGRRWGIRRLRELISELARQGLSPADQVEAILRAIQTWREKAQANDDITFLIVPAQSILTHVGTQTPHSA